jgi:hypothetical protein
VNKENIIGEFGNFYIVVAPEFYECDPVPKE